MDPALSEHPGPVVAKDEGAAEREAIMRAIIDAKNMTPAQRSEALHRLDAATKKLEKNAIPLPRAQSDESAQLHYRGPLTQQQPPPTYYPQQQPPMQYAPAYPPAYPPVYAQPPPMMPAYGPPAPFPYWPQQQQGRQYSQWNYPGSPYAVGLEDDTMAIICSPFTTIGGVFKLIYRVLLFAISWGIVIFVGYSCWKLWNKL